MIIPKHCREVSVWKVDFRLDADTIKENLIGKESYYRTKYVVLNKGEEYAVAELKKTDGEGLFNEISSVKIISLPNDTAYVEDRDLDVLSRPLLAEKASGFEKETVVVRGMLEHVSFVHKPTFKKIRILEVVPPFPPKLTALARMALQTEEIETPVEIIEELIDIRVLAEETETDEVIFACEAGGITIPEKKIFYMDQNPKVKDATIVGCDRTRRVGRHLYGRDLPFIDICPRHLVEDSDMPTLVKCCELQTTGFTKKGKLAVVPWGAKISDVVGAMKYLLGES